MCRGWVWPALSPTPLTPRKRPSSSTERSSPWHQGSVVTWNIRNCEALLRRFLNFFFLHHPLLALCRRGYCQYPQITKILLTKINKKQDKKNKNHTSLFLTSSQEQLKFKRSQDVENKWPKRLKVFTDVSHLLQLYHTLLKVYMSIAKS